MRISFHTVLSAVLAVSMLSACAGNRSRLKVGQQAGGEVVEAEGLAPYNADDLIETKRGSLSDAQRNAVEKAVGVFVSARTRVEKAVAIENNILTRTDGYVRKYDILDEGPQGDLYHTRIRALVALKEIEKDLREMSLLSRPELKRPRVTISLSEEIDRQPASDNAAASALQRALSAQGFVVVSAGREKDAEIAIRGKASSHPFETEGLGGFVSYRARLTAEAVRAGTSDVIASISREASGLGGNAELAGLKALETVGELAGNGLAETLPGLWSSQKNVLIYVEGVKDFTGVESVRKHLSAQPGVTDITMRLFDEEMAQFEVELGSVDLATLAAGLESSTVSPLKVVEAQGQSLRLRMP